MTVAESLAKLAAVAQVAQEAHVPLQGGISTSFGCPFEGEVPLGQLESIVARLVELGFSGICLADTTGMANPAQVRRTLEYLMPKFPDVEWTLHTHNTRAMAIPNVLAAMDCGVTHFDASIGGLGGCPFAPGATGNVCTEDLVHCLHAMGYETGIALDRLIDTARCVEEIIGRPLPGQVMKAGTWERRYPLPERVMERLAVRQS
jgi:hydroxymethylglutaryl-CoA lyase